MADQFGQQVTAVLSEDAQRLSGEEAVSMNIAAGSAVAEAVRTTLGPRGMDKMLVSDTGDVVVTNDGVTVLEEMDVDHPVADMVVDVAETQETEVGDGTTTAVVVAGELLGEAEDLLDRGIHAATIVGGYRHAAEQVDDILADIAVEVSPDDTEILERVAKTAMTGKGAEAAVETLAPTRRMPANFESRPRVVPTTPPTRKIPTSTGLNPWNTVVPRVTASTTTENVQVARIATMAA